MISIGLPIYRQSIILPVALRGLSEQLNAGDWEIILCTEDNIEPIVREWSGRLFAAGCKNIRIIKLTDWIPLPQKWRRIGRELHPDSVGMMLQAADCYPHKNRIAQSRKAMNEGYDWYQENRGYFYDIRTGVAAEYFNNSSHTHLNMCMAARWAKQIPLSDRRKVIDGWMLRTMISPKIYTHNGNCGGVDFNGLSNISLERAGMMQKGQPPFTRVDKIELPELPELPKVHVLTRTFRRPDQFKICRESVINQTYPVNHIVGCEEDCDYYPAIKLSKKTPPPADGYVYPWNMHFTEMYPYAKGWLIHLDDDDKFASDTALHHLVKCIDHKNQLILWRVNIAGRLIPSDKNFKKNIIRADISGIGFMFHSDHLPVNWGYTPCGDYRVIKELSTRLEVKWIEGYEDKKYFTQTQGLPGATIRLRK